MHHSHDGGVVCGDRKRDWQMPEPQKRKLQDDRRCERNCSRRHFAGPETVPQEDESRRDDIHRKNMKRHMVAYHADFPIVSNGKGRKRFQARALDIERQCPLSQSRLELAQA